MRNNRVFALIYRIVFAIPPIIGIMLNTYMFTSKFKLRSFLYYTTLSNIVAIVLFITLAVKTAISIKKDGKFGDVAFDENFSFVTTVNITLTFIVFWTLLAPGLVHADYDLLSFGNNAVHTITPLATLFHLLIFYRHKRFAYRVTYLSLIFPVSYALFTLVLGAFKLVQFPTFGTSEDILYFPYFFFDYYKYGAKILLYIIPMILSVIIFAHLMFAIFVLVHHRREVKSASTST